LRWQPDVFAAWTRLDAPRTSVLGWAHQARSGRSMAAPWHRHGPHEGGATKRHALGAARQALSGCQPCFGALRRVAERVCFQSLRDFCARPQHSSPPSISRDPRPPTNNNCHAPRRPSTHPPTHPPTTSPPTPPRQPTSFHHPFPPPRPHSFTATTAATAATTTTATLYPPTPSLIHSPHRHANRTRHCRRAHTRARPPLPHARRARGLPLGRGGLEPLRGPPSARAAAARPPHRRDRWHGRDTRDASGGPAPRLLSRPTARLEPTLMRPPGMPALMPPPQHGPPRRGQPSRPHIDVRPPLMQAPSGPPPDGGAGVPIWCQRPPQPPPPPPTPPPPAGPPPPLAPHAGRPSGVWRSRRIAATEQAVALCHHQHHRQHRHRRTLGHH